MKLLALDMATQAGWAHSDGPAGSWNLSVRKDESGGMRLIRFRAKLEEIRRAVGVQVVVYEQPRHRGTQMINGRAVNTVQQVVVHSQLQGTLLVWAADNGIEYRAYSPSEIKSRATGKGNAAKAIVLEAARRHWPHCGDDNEADARWLLVLACEQLGLPTDRFFPQTA